MQQFDKVRACFSPRRRDDLRPEVLSYIGRVMEWEAMWIIEPGENQFEGQWAMMPLGEEDPPFGWVPMEDLQIEGTAENG